MKTKEEILISKGLSWFSEEVECEYETGYVKWGDCLKAMEEFTSQCKCPHCGKKSVS